MEENGNNFQPFFFFIFIILAYIFTFLRNRIKKKAEAEEKNRRVATAHRQQPPPAYRKPPPSIPTVSLIEEPVEEVTFFRKRGKPRIVKIVQGIPSKKDLILLSEILPLKSDVK